MASRLLYSQVGSRSFPSKARTKANRAPASATARQSTRP